MADTDTKVGAKPGSTPQAAPQEVWDAIRREFEAGIRSVEDIATTFGVKQMTIYARARRQNWQRDLAHKIRKRAEQKILMDGVVDRPRTAADIKAEHNAVELAAEVQKQVMTKHRNGVGKASTLCDSLLSELTAQTMTPEELEHISEMMALTNGQSDDAQVDPKVVEGYLKSWRKLLSLNNRAQILKSLADSLKNLVTLERLVYGISDNANGEANGKKDEQPAERDDRDIARRIAFVLAKGLKPAE